MVLNEIYKRANILILYNLKYSNIDNDKYSNIDIDECKLIHFFIS